MLTGTVDHFPIQLLQSLLAGRSHARRDPTVKDLQALESENLNLTGKLQVMEQELIAAKVTVADLTNELQRHDKQISALQDCCNQQKRTHVNLIALLQARDQALSEAEANVIHLTTQLKQRDQEFQTAKNNLTEAQEDVELTLRQLHHAQEELENYCRRFLALDQLTHALAKENYRAMNLLVRMIRLQASGR